MIPKPRLLVLAVAPVLAQLTVNTLPACPQLQAVVQQVLWIYRDHEPASPEYIKELTKRLNRHVPAPPTSEERAASRNKK